MAKLGLGCLLVQTLSFVNGQDRLDDLIDQENFIDQLEQTFIRSKKWESVDLQLGSMDLQMGENVGVMMPAVTGESSKFSVFQRVGFRFEFLRKDQNDTYEFVDLREITERSGFIDKVGQASFPLLDGDDVADFQMWPSVLRRSFKNAAKSNLCSNCNIGNCTAAVLEMACGQWEPEEPSNTCVPDTDGEDCGPGTREIKKCFTYPDGTQECEFSDEPCDLGPCYDNCTCTAQTSANLEATECRLDDSSSCRPCNADDVCGSFETTDTPCSVTCGNGTYTETECFIWAGVYKPNNHTGPQNANGSYESCEAPETLSCFEGECPPPEYGDCSCTSTDILNITATKCQVDDATACMPCEAANATDACGIVVSDVTTPCTATCGDATKNHTLCFNWVGDGGGSGQSPEGSGDDECETEILPCDFDECPPPEYTNCTCTSTNVNALTGNKCEVDNPGTCISCNTTEAEDSCGSWDPPTLGNCSVTCGGGLQTSDKCFVWSNGDDDSCITESNLDCNTQSCPAWGNWTAWSNCTESCAPPTGKGDHPQSERTRCWNDGYGEDCANCTTNGGNCTETETQDCAMDTCELVYDDCVCTSTDVDALTATHTDQYNDTSACNNTAAVDACGVQDANWSEWTDCSAECDGGTRDRDFCFTWNDGAITPTCDTESEACNEQPCGAWAEWGQWGPCDGSCMPTDPDVDSPQRSRYRCWNNGVEEICSNAQCDEDECIQYEYEDCDGLDECDACSWSEWAEWSACQPECEEGLKIRRREGTDSCEDESVQSDTCENDFPVDCDPCFDKYDKCDQIDQRFCTDVRYREQLRLVCQSYCEYCDVRKKRSVWDRIWGNSFNVDQSILETVDGLTTKHYDN